MPFTNAQTTAFFEDADQMAIPHRTVAQLATEGITAVDDLAEFEDDDFKQVAYNLSHPPAVLNAAVPPVLVPQEPFVLGAKSLRRLKVAAKAIRYYQSIDRATTSGNMHFTNVLRNFELQWNSLEDKVEADAPDVPKITRNLAVTRWSESFVDFLNQSYGVRKAPLAYVIRDDAVVAVPGPPLAHHQPHSNEHGSVEGELIARLSHTHPIFRDDNKMVYDHLEVATCSTIYAASIKPFQRTKNGRSAYQALISQHAGEDKWEKELKQQESFMKSRVWKGNSNFSLEKFIEQHRAAYISMQQCSLHVTFQLPDEHTRV